jgi:hypothetical protein
LNKSATPANKKVYATWDIYEKAFLSQGKNLKLN